MKMTVAYLFLLLLPALAGATVVVPLNPALPDTLTESQITTLNLFPDLTGVSSVWFEKAVWGGIIAHLQIRQSYLQKNIERSIPRHRWLEMQQCGEAMVAGQPPCRDDDFTSEDLAAAKDSPQVIKVWPEVAARNRKLPPELAADSGPQYPDVAGRWLVSGGLGYQHNISSFGEMFSDMLVFQLGFSHALTKNIMPCFGFSAGFGDMNSDYEDLVGDGHGSNYSAMAGLMLRAPVSKRTSFYASGQGGYFRHSLQWGGLFEDPESGQQVQGYAREYGDWGFAVHFGVLLQKSHARKARFFDFNVGVMWGEVERWSDVDGDIGFTAEGDDAWLMFMFRFWDQI